MAQTILRLDSKMKIFYIFVMLITCIGIPKISHTKIFVPKSCGQPILTDARHEHTACGSDFIDMKQLQIDFTAQEEVWKDIPNYEGCYQVSSLGRVKSLARSIPTKTRGIRRTKELIISQKLGGEDKFWKYNQVVLQKELEREYASVHRLMAITFIPNPKNKPQVNHIDGIKTNNRLDNLEWSTISENGLHATKTGLLKNQKGKPNKLSKPVTQYDLNGDKLNTYPGLSMAKQATGVSRVNIWRCLNGKLSTAGGFIWKRD